VRPGAVIGRYRLLRTLGNGGMGIVYRAEQRYPVRRHVALKLIKAGMDSEQAMARFEAERQALALMDHPGIARVFDAGTTDAGRLYFVMELVEGVPITNYCSDRHLDLPARLRLFTEVCHAIQHAHQKGIVHRDIKPSNVLVADCDGRPAPKVIDFGVAKAVSGSPSLSGSMSPTIAGAVVGTYEYMSPEQARGGADVDTRSDIYSLGVLLYELLTGTTPLEHSAIRDLPDAEVRRQICEEEPPRPSARTLRDHQDAHALRRDLDWIAMKSLEKDPSRRYATASGLAADLDRYLEGEAVEARPPSAAYILAKLARRYRTPLIAAAAFAALLVAATAVSTMLAIRANRAERETRVDRDRAVAAERTARQARDLAAGAESQAARERDDAVTEKRRANTEAAVSAAVNQFLEDDLLAQASSRRQLADAHEPDPDLKVREALDRAAAAVSSKFGSQPSVEASIRTTIGNAYLDLGLDVPAQEQLTKALDLNRRIFSADSPQAIETLDLLGQAYFMHDKYKEAEPAFEQVVAWRRKSQGPRNPDTILALSNLALTHGRLINNRLAEQEATGAIRLSEAALGPDDPLTLRTRANLGKIYLGQDALPAQLRTKGIFEMAANVFASVLKDRERVLGPEHPDTIDSMTNLSTAYHRLQRFAEAEEQERQIIAIRTLVWGPEHPSTLAAKANLAVDLRAQGKMEECTQLDRELLAERRRIFGPDHPATLETMGNLANDRRNFDPGEAERLDEEILASRRRTQGVEHADTMDAMWSLAGDHVRNGKGAEAAQLYRELAEVRLRLFGPDDPRTMESYGGWARAYRGMGRFREAEDFDTRYLDWSIRVNGADNEYTHYRRMNLALDYLFEKKYEQAESLASIAFAGLRDQMGREHFRTELAVFALAGAWHGEGKNDQAEQLIREGLAIDGNVRPGSWYEFYDRAILGAATGSSSLLRTGYDGMVARRNLIEEYAFIPQAAAWLAESYTANGQSELAAEWRIKADPVK
jgi:non-specific serine/threonine protein kinase/serine/threonine-protein kinase